MISQDAVAHKLVRVSSEEIHRLMDEYSKQGLNWAIPWAEIAFRPATRELLLSHGWTLKEFVDDEDY